MLAAQKVGGHKMAVLYCAENPACKQTVAPLQAAGKQFGIPVVFNASVLASAPNYTAQCLAAKARGGGRHVHRRRAGADAGGGVELRPAGLHAPPGLRRSGLLAADGRQAGLGRLPRHPGQHPVLRDQHARLEDHARRLCSSIEPSVLTDPQYSVRRGHPVDDRPADRRRGGGGRGRDDQPDDRDRR